MKIYLCFSLLELQGYYSIKTNIKVCFMLAAVVLLFVSFSIVCLLIATVKESSIDFCSDWFRTTYCIRAILCGFYTSLFNPLCFVGHSPDFFVLRLRCNSIGGIARVTRRLIKQLNKHGVLPQAPNVVPNVWFNVRWGFLPLSIYDVYVWEAFQSLSFSQCKIIYSTELMEKTNER